MIKYLVLLILIALILPDVGKAGVWYVHPDSSINTIQAGLDSCATDDTVIVAPGLYYENIIWPDVDGIYLTGETTPEEVIIDGDSAGSVISIHNTEVTEITGFTIQHGSNAGIWLGGTSPVISNNIITNNTNDYHGGGISGYEGAPIIRDNTITYNICTGYGGGGVALSWAFPAELHNNIIKYNTGLYSNGTGGVYCANAVTIIESCNILYNNGHGVYNRHLMGRYPTDNEAPAVNYNNIVGNTGYGVYQDYEGQWLNARNNWWGDPSGPGGSGPGSGDEVSSWVVYSPWLIDSFTLCHEQPVVQPALFNLRTYPNPFTNELNITWQSHSECPNGHQIAIYDVTGRKIRRYPLSSGTNNTLVWMGDDEIGRLVPCGIYFIALQSNFTHKGHPVIKLR